MARKNSTRVKAPDSSRSMLEPPRLSREFMTPAAESSYVGEGCWSTCPALTREPSWSLDLRSSIRIAAWNVRTLSEVPFQVSLHHILLKHQIDIACISECRIPGSDMIKIEKSTLIFSGGKDKTYGVGIMISPLLSRMLISWRAVSDRLLLVRLKHKHGCLSIISVYAPTELATFEVKDKFYNDLSDLVLHVPPHDKLIVAGDFNATSGSDRTGFENIIGPFGSGIRNDNSTRLISLCSATNLAITGSWFQRRNIHRWTWISPDKHTKKEIDHFLLRDRRDATKLKVMRGIEPPGNSDHLLVLLHFRISFPFSKPKNKNKKIDSQRLLHDATCRNAFRLELRNRFDALTNIEDNSDPETMCNSFTKIIFDSAAKVTPPVNYHHKPWLSQTSLNLISQKKCARLANDKAKHKELQTLFKICSNDDYESFLNSIADKAEEANRRHDMKGIYKAIHSLSGSSKNDSSAHINNSDGSPCSSIEEALDIWQKHFNSALNHPPSLDPWSSPRPPESRDEIEPPDVSTIMTAISKLKLGRSSGPDGISAEMLSACSDIIAPYLESIFKVIWRTGKIPQIWKDANIIPVYKNKGCKHSCANYRPISLLSIVGKLFASILLNYSQEYFLNSRIPQQSGFTPGRSTTDAILTLRILSDIHRLYKQSLYVAYIDFKAAFDSVDRSALWAALTSLNLPSPLHSLISELHNGTSSCVSINGKLSDKFNSLSGVRQGCVLAPSLFCLVMDIVLKAANPSITYIADTPFSDGAYADDVAFIDTSIDSLCSSLVRLQTEAAKFGLNISWAKTKIQNISNSTTPTPIQIGNNSVEVVDDFNYLGCTFSSETGSYKEILRRIALAGQAMNNLSCVWKRKRLSTGLKVKIFNSMVIPILLYGSETWIVRQADANRLSGFYMQCQRRFLGIRWYELISNDTISAMTGLPPITNIIRSRRLSLFGHVARLGPDVPAFKALTTGIDVISGERIPQGWRRHRGRPPKTWLDQIREDLPDHPWEDILACALDRNLWREVAMAQLGD